MRTSTMQRNVADFGMDTISLAGPLEAKLAAVKAAGFGQIMLAAVSYTHLRAHET